MYLLCILPRFGRLKEVIQMFSFSNLSLFLNEYIQQGGTTP